MTTAKRSIRHVEREDVLLWLFTAAPVLAWIVAQQVSFLLTRSLCSTGHRWVLYLVMGPSFAVAAASGAASLMKWNALASKKSSDRTSMYRRFMALGGVLLAAICTLSILALMIAAAVHRVCD